MILGLDKYWKTSPGSTLEGFNIGLAVFNDIVEFLIKFDPMVKNLLIVIADSKYSFSCFQTHPGSDIFLTLISSA